MYFFRVSLTKSKLLRIGIQYKITSLIVSHFTIELSVFFKSQHGVLLKLGYRVTVDKW
jgi:hypothetical protein